MNKFSDGFSDSSYDDLLNEYAGNALGNSPSKAEPQKKVARPASVKKAEPMKTPEFNIDISKKKTALVQQLQKAVLLHGVSGNCFVITLTQLPIDTLFKEISTTQNLCLKRRFSQWRKLHGKAAFQTYIISAKYLRSIPVYPPANGHNNYKSN